MGLRRNARSYCRSKARAPRRAHRVDRRRLRSPRRPSRVAHCRSRCTRQEMVVQAQALPPRLTRGPHRRVSPRLPRASSRLAEPARPQSCERCRQGTSSKIPVSLNVADLDVHFPCSVATEALVNAHDLFLSAESELWAILIAKPSGPITITAHTRSSTVAGGLT